MPVEADLKYWHDYKLLLNLGWHSANAEDMAKITDFVRGGGVYFAGIPQYSQHLGREFLRDMSDLNLLNNGDLSDFCGIKICGKSQDEYSGNYQGFSGDESSSRTFNFSPDEDGKCYLAKLELADDTEVVVRDSANNRPLIVKHQYGKGIVYTLCAWAYPGHDKLAQVMAAFLRKLCAEYRGEIYIEDASCEVFWNIRDCGNYKLITLLNTDWTTQGNSKQVKLYTPDTDYNLEVKERELLMVYLYGNKLIETYGNIYLDINEDGKIIAHSANNIIEKVIDFSKNISTEVCL